MPNGVPIWIQSRRFWMMWGLAIILVLAQFSWGVALTGATHPARMPIRHNENGGPTQLHALPLWFTPIASADRVTRPDQRAQGTSFPNLFAPPSAQRLQAEAPSLIKSSSVLTATLDQVVTYTVVYTIPAGFSSSALTLEDNASRDPDVTFNTAPGTYSGPTAMTGATPAVSPITPTFSSFDHIATWALEGVNNPSGDPYVYQITYQATVNPPFFWGSWGDVAVNNADLSYDGGEVSASSAITIYQPDVFLRFYADASNGGQAVQPGDVPSDRYVEDLIQGDVVTFTLQITNADLSQPARLPYLSPAHDLGIHFELPDFLQFEAAVGDTPDPSQATQPDGWTVLDWQGYSELASLAPQEALAYTFRATVTPDVTANRDENPLYRVNYDYAPGGASDPYEQIDSLRLRTRTVALVKTAEPDALRVGDEVTYTVQFTVPFGVSIQTPISVVDTLADGLEWRRSLGAAPDFSTPPDVSRANDTTIIWDWTGGDISESGTYTLSFAAALSSTLKETGEPVPWAKLQNVAQLNWHDPHGGALETDNYADVQVVRPSLPLDKEVWNGEWWGETLDLSAGAQQVLFRIRGKNTQLGIRNEPNNTSHAYEIVISDTLPAGFKLVDADPTSYVTTTVGNRTQIIWNLYDVLTPSLLLPIHYITATAPVTLTPDLDPLATFENWAAIHYSDRPGSPPDDNAYQNVDNARVNVDELVALTQSAELEGDAIRIGDTVTFTVAAEIAPGSVLYDPFFSDQGVGIGMRAGYHYVDGSFDIAGASAVPFTIARGGLEELKWTLQPTMVENLTGSPYFITSSYQVRFTGVDLNGAPVYASSMDDYRRSRSGQNDVRFYWYTQPGRKFADRSDLRARVSPGIIQPLLVDPNLPPEKTLVEGGPIAESGDLLTYRFTVYNTGLAPAYDVFVSDSLPPGLQFQSYQARVYPAAGLARPSYVPAVATAPGAGQEGMLDWVFDEIAAGDGDAVGSSTQLVLTYTLEVLDGVGAGATLVNSAWVSDYSSLPGDQAFERHYAYLGGAGDQAASVSVPDATIGKSASASVVGLNESIVYTITVPNQPLGATMYNVAITDTMPPGPPGPIEIVDATAPGAASIDVASDSVIVQYDSIPADSQRTIVIDAQVPGTAVFGLVQNEATATWEDAQSAGTQHTATSDPVGVTVSTPDVMVTKNAPAGVAPGQPIMYTIAYQNVGTASAENVRLTDTLPNGVSFAGFNDNRPVTQISPGVWDLGSLAAGEGGIIWLAASVSSAATPESSLENAVTISTRSLGDNPENNHDTAVTTVSTGALLEVTKTATPDPVLAGDRIEYTLVVKNTGLAATQNLVITDRVPSNTSFVSASAGGSLAGGVVTWRPADIGVNEQTEVSFEVQVPSGVLPGTMIVNDAYGATADNASSQSNGPVTVRVSAETDEVLLFLPVVIRNHTP
jgi:uncharacterized repeat protein (TIGR01451 family)/fimbrial isopeptide formation D2 family protein